MQRLAFIMAVLRIAVNSGRGGQDGPCRAFPNEASGLREARARLLYLQASVPEASSDKGREYAQGLPPIVSLHWPNDIPATRAAIDWCKENNIPRSRPSEYQLKVGPVNYYPKRQTITVDSQRTSQHGFAAFKVLASDYAISPIAVLDE